MSEWVGLVLLTLERQRHGTEDVRNEYLSRAGLPEKHAEVKGSLQGVCWEGLGSGPAEGRGRKQRGQREKLSHSTLPTRASATSTGTSGASGPAELSQVGTRELGLYPTVLVSGYGLPLAGGETQDQAVFVR